MRKVRFTHMLAGGAALALVLTFHSYLRDKEVTPLAPLSSTPATPPKNETPTTTPKSPIRPSPSPAPPSSSREVFLYTFNVDGSLEEKNSLAESPSPYFWVASGGGLLIEKGVGKTFQGEQGLISKWRVLYRLMNPRDTDQGKYPQNTFRLVTKREWRDAAIEAEFRIVRDNFTASPNRNASNGLLLMNRYIDQNTLYYAGIRVDGTAIIKKKYHGTYYTMAQEKIFPGIYAEGEGSNLLPHLEWIALRSEVREKNGVVTVSLYMRRGSLPFRKILEAKDTGMLGGTPPIIDDGHSGIRTDFMDVEFRMFRVEKL